MPDVKFSNQYPYTDFHELNLDWVIKEVKFWSERVGKSIQKIELTGTVGLVDTYTITYSDGSTSTYDVTNGNGIASVAKTGTVGLIDTYTITFQDGSTTTFEVRNGTASIDPTLSLSDYAADAKATGDALDGKADAADAFGVKYVTDQTMLRNVLGVTKQPGNLINCAECVNNVYIAFNTGAEVPNAGYFATGFIPVTPGVVYRSNKGRNHAFYNSAKTYLTGVASDIIQDGITAPASSAYIRYTINKTTDGMTDPFELYFAPASSFDDSVVIPTLKLDEIATTFGRKYVDVYTLLRKVKGVIKQPGNLINCAECVDNVAIAYYDGTEISNTGYFATGYIPVTPGVVYRSNKGRNHAFYNSAKTYLTGVASDIIQDGITAPASSAYIRYTINKTTDGMTDPFELYFAPASSFDDSVIIPKFKNSWCYNLKINWIGDSIVDGQDFDEEVCAALGLIKQSEYGINGSTIALAADGTDGRNALCVRYTNMSDDADIVAVSCGTNDFMYAWCPIGDIDSTQNNTFYGALKTLCEGLINKYPNKLIFFTTPIKRAQSFANGDGGTYTPDGVMTTPFSKNKYGLTLGEYGDIIKEVCGYYSIPVLDMYNESLLNPHIASQQYLFDAALTHPNTAGQKIMARRVAGWITQLGYNIS